jgi:alanyl-tRNA synthetase
MAAVLGYHGRMDTLMAYERDPYECELATVVVRAGVDGERPYAVLADTICFPEGGGQPADRGWLGDRAVLDVQWAGGEIRHYLAAPAATGAALLRLDWARRFDHMQQHTGQHLLTAVAQDRHGWPTTAFHLGPELCDVELDVAALDGGRLDALEEAVNTEIRAARPVVPRRVGEPELAALAVRTRGLPAGHSGDIRLVEIAGVDLNTCGGTHVRSTAEIQCVKLLGTEPMRGGTRVFFAAGGRVLRLLAAHERRNAALRALLGSPDSALVEAVQSRLEDLRRTEKRVRATEDELATAIAATLAGQGDTVVDVHLDGHDLPFLQLIGRKVAAVAPHKVVLLTAAAGADNCFVVAAGPQAGVDVQSAGRRVAAALGGRGGGSGLLAQGRAPSLAARDAALRALRDAPRGG